MATKLLKIGSHTPPCPSTYVGTTSTGVNTGRNVSGVVVGGVVRENIAAVTATWSYITIEDWKKILQQFNSVYGGSFYQRVTFFNQDTGTVRTAKMYVSDRTTGGMCVFDENGKPKGWQDAKLELIEK